MYSLCIFVLGKNKLTYLSQAHKSASIFSSFAKHLNVPFPENNIPFFHVFSFFSFGTQVNTLGKRLERIKVWALGITDLVKWLNLLKIPFTQFQFLLCFYDIIKITSVFSK